MYPRKGLVTRNTHVKYLSSSFHCWKVMKKVYVKLNSKVKVSRSNYWHPRTVLLTNNTYMWNTKTLAFTVSKLLAKFKFYIKLQNDNFTYRTKTCSTIFDLGSIKRKAYINLVLDINFKWEVIPKYSIYYYNGKERRKGSWNRVLIT